jgi:hypothetical protein
LVHLPVLPVVLAGIVTGGAVPALLPTLAASWLGLLAWAGSRSDPMALVSRR